jgi:serine/threonine-protein kinase HipA
MVFNILARNQDDHTKNLSFIMDRQGSWRLSPAYDMVYQYDPLGKWARVHQLSANGKRDNFTLADLEEVANKFEIYQAKEIRNQVAEGIALWPKLAQEKGIKPEIIKAIKSNHRLDIIKKN